MLLMHSQLMLIWRGAELISLSVLFLLLFVAANKDREDANDVAPQKKIISEVKWPSQLIQIQFLWSSEELKVAKLWNWWFMVTFYPLLEVLRTNRAFKQKKFLFFQQRCSLNLLDLGLNWIRVGFLFFTVINGKFNVFPEQHASPFWRKQKRERESPWRG